MCESGKQVFYGVYIPQGSIPSGEEHPGAVYEEKGKVLEILKKYKTARFNTFSSREDALSFGSNIESVEVASAEENETVNIYKTPTPQELIKLKKLIEANNVEAIREKVEANPRYLISSMDGPTLIQEVFRYNALHVAASSRNPETFRLVLGLIQDKSYFSRVYTDKKGLIENAMDHLLDLYVNNPDKGLNETPLHFASKYGSIEIIRMLLSVPCCDRIPKNKFGQTPSEVACNRADPQKMKLKSYIEELLRQPHYVAVLRCPDNTSDPIVLKPWSPGQFKSRLSESPKPTEPQYELRALAGPMTPTQSEEMHGKWKTLGKDDKKIACSDWNKGYENILRRFAREVNSPWREYWNFLNYHCDLTSQEGLQKLEEHLKTKYKQTMHQALLEQNKNLQLRLEQLGSQSPVSELVRRLGAVKLDPCKEEPEETLSLECCCNTAANNIVNILLNVCAGIKSLAWGLKTIETELKTLENRLSARNPKHMKSIHTVLANKCLSKIGIEEMEKIKELVAETNMDKHSECVLKQLLEGRPTKECKCSFRPVTKAKKQKSAQHFYRTFLYPSKASPALEKRKSSDETDCIINNLIEDVEPRVLRFDDADDDVVVKKEVNFTTPPSTPEEETLVTPEEGPEVYVHGQSPTHDDKNAYEAVKDLEIDEQRFPYIAIWLHLMNYRKDKLATCSFSPMTPSPKRYASSRSVDAFMGSPLTKTSPMLNYLGFRR